MFSIHFAHFPSTLQLAISPLTLTRILSLIMAAKDEGQIPYKSQKEGTSQKARGTEVLSQH